jgi:energy-coupling factor transporter transmembrane protein EcfT
MAIFPNLVIVHLFIVLVRILVILVLVFPSFGSKLFRIVQLTVSSVAMQSDDELHAAIVGELEACNLMASRKLPRVLHNYEMHRYRAAEMLLIACRSIPRVLHEWIRMVRAYCGLKAKTRRGGMKVKPAVAVAWKKWITWTAHLMSKRRPAATVEQWRRQTELASGGGAR